MTRDSLFDDIKHALDDVYGKFALLVADRGSNAYIDSLEAIVSTNYTMLESIRKSDISDKELKDYKLQILKTCNEFNEIYKQLINQPPIG